MSGRPTNFARSLRSIPRRRRWLCTRTSCGTPTCSTATISSRPQDWFVATVQARVRQSEVNLDRQLHPDNVWKRKRDGLDASELGEGDSHRQVRRRAAAARQAASSRDADRHPIAVRRHRRWGYDPRSVGIELPCFGVPVLTAGTGFYSVVEASRSIRRRVRNTSTRLSRIQDVEPLTPGAGRARSAASAYALFRLRPLRFDSFRTVIRPLSGIGHPLDHDLVVQERSRTDLEQARPTAPPGRVGGRLPRHRLPCHGPIGLASARMVYVDRRSGHEP